MSDEERLGSLDTVPLIRCENEKCRQLSTEAELKKTNWKCPYCGKRISKPQFPSST